MSAANTPTLLSAARAFIGKSVVVAIAPLALATVVQAQTIFSVPTGTSSGNFASSATASNASFTAIQLPTANGFTGTLQQNNVTFTFTANAATGSAFPGSGQEILSGTPITVGMTIPFAFALTISSTGTIVVGNTTFGSGTSVLTPVSGLSVGTGTGTFSNTGLFTATSTVGSLFPNFQTAFSNASIGDTLTFTMGNSQGLAIGSSSLAVPEPSTWALLGLGAVTLVAARRFRRKVA